MCNIKCNIRKSYIAQNIKNTLHDAAKISYGNYITT